MHGVPGALPPVSSPTGRETSRVFRVKEPVEPIRNPADRGKLVDSSALVDALRSRQLGGAGLDAFADEPVDPAAPLLRQSNVIATPHIAGDTDASFEASSAAVKR